MAPHAWPEWSARLRPGSGALDADSAACVLREKYSTLAFTAKNTIDNKNPRGKQKRQSISRVRIRVPLIHGIDSRASIKISIHRVTAGVNNVAIETQTVDGPTDVQ